MGIFQTRRAYGSSFWNFVSGYIFRISFLLDVELPEGYISENGGDLTRGLTKNSIFQGRFKINDSPHIQVPWGSHVSHLLSEGIGRH